jgi:hypothetical protein
MKSPNLRAFDINRIQFEVTQNLFQYSKTNNNVINIRSQETAVFSEIDLAVGKVR